MKKPTRVLIIIGCITAALAVMLGAFGAHALKDALTAQRLATFETAVRYQFYHAFAIIVAAGVHHVAPRRSVIVAASLFVGGVVVFSGSLYLLVATDTGWLGAITPIGGVAFIAGWLTLAWSVLRTQASQ